MICDAMPVGFCPSYRPTACYVTIKLPKPLEAVQLLPTSYRVYTASLERIVNRTPRLEMILEALEAFGTSEPRTHDVF